MEMIVFHDFKLILIIRKIIKLRLLFIHIVNINDHLGF